MGGKKNKKTSQNHQQTASYSDFFDSADLSLKDLDPEVIYSPNFCLANPKTH